MLPIHAAHIVCAVACVAYHAAHILCAVVCA